MSGAPTTSGIVLAGGRARRMGTDKALLRIDGVRLVDRAIAALASACEDVVVASGRRTIPDLEVRQVPDRPRDVGPLGGLISGLSEAAHPLALVLAVDIPDPDMALFAGLARWWAGEAAIIPSASGTPQPVHAVWSVDAVPTLTALAHTGARSLIDVARQLDASILDDAQTAGLVDHDRWAFNLNRPSDLPHPGRP